MDRFLGALRGAGLVRLLVMAGVGIGLLAAIIALTTGFMTQPKQVLWSNLDPKEASEVVAALDQVTGIVTDEDIDEADHAWLVELGVSLHVANERAERAGG